jgi:hypothetical protein
MKNPIRLSGALFAAAVLGLTLGMAGQAQADDAPAPAVAPAPAAAPALRDLCTDRPTKSNGPCTVDAGHWQVESDILNVTVQRDAGVSVQTWLLTSPTVKYGLTDNSDIELSFTPDEIVRTVDHNAGTSSTLSGFGDVYLRAKYEFIGATGGAFAATLYPYIKAPTARSGLGDGAWEEGLIVPMQLTLPKGWSLGVDPEADWIHNAAGSGYHWAASTPITFTHALMDKVTGSLEFWAGSDFDPAHTTRQYSFDLAGAWQVGTNLQFDGGLNFGLNRATPGFQAYVGVSKRF